MMNSIITSSSTSTGTGGVGSTFINGFLKVATIVKNTDFTVPAGAYIVEILNNDIIESINVNGVVVGPQLKVAYSYKIDYFSNKQDLIPVIIVVNPQAIEILLQVEYPSSSVVDPSLI